ncbi:MAG: hypothetical protein ABR574_03825 [Cryomorphaceae bacterium]|nr:hypothetical protein [Flavobacteriales bacterium]
MRKLTIISLCLALLPLLVFGQNDQKIQDAYALYNQGMYVDASEMIDEVVITKNGKSSKVAWHIRGFIYKDLYIHVDNEDRNSKAREMAVESFKRSIRLDEAGTLEENNRKALRYLGISFFNDASDIIEERDIYEIDRANDKYLVYKDIMLFLYPDTALKDKDIEVYLALSTAHRKIYESDRDENEEHYQKSLDYLKLVLEIDPKNWAANYSYSVSHYNRGAANLQKLANAEKLMDIYQIQAESMRSIEIALPYMYKAYEIDPEKIEAIKGLKWIFFNLHQEEESEKYDKKLKDLIGD